jgi:hypothetical protein
MLVEYSIRAEAEIIKIAKIIVLAKNTPKALGGLIRFFLVNFLIKAFSFRSLIFLSLI